MGFEAVTLPVADLLTCTHDARPDEIVKNEIELLVVRLLRLARRKGGDATAQVQLSVAVLKYLRPIKADVPELIAYPDKSALMRIEVRDFERAELGA
jgi:hypothetical protein